MVIPVGPEGEHQKLYLVTMDADGVNYKTESLMGVVYVPLVEPNKQKQSGPSYLS